MSDLCTGKQSISSIKVSVQPKLEKSGITYMPSFISFIRYELLRKFAFARTKMYLTSV